MKSGKSIGDGRTVACSRCVMGIVGSRMKNHVLPIIAMVINADVNFFVVSVIYCAF